MFAIIEIGGKQYKVSTSDKIQVEKLEAKKDSKVEFDKVLLTSEQDGKNLQIGMPYLKNAKVEAKVIEEQFKGEKIRVFKFIPKKRHSKAQGHRQLYTILEITGIKA